MSKRKSNRGGNTAAKNSKIATDVKAKIVAAVLVVLALVYVITSLAMGYARAAGAPLWNPFKWGKTAAQTVGEINEPDVGEINEPDVGDIDEPDYELTPAGYSAFDENGNLMRSGVIYSMPNQITFIGDNTVTTARAATASDITMTNGQSVTISATITPDDASDKRVIWSSDSQYVTVTPLSEGSNIATVTLTNYSSSVFSQNAVTITCTSVSDPSKYATCSVSRLATLREVVLRSTITPSAIAYGGRIYASAWAESYDGISCLYYGDIKNIVIDSISLVYNSTLFNKITQFLKAENIDINFADYYGDCGVDSLVWQVLTPYVMFGVGSDSTKFNNAFLSACREINGDFVVDVSIAVRAEYVFNGVNFGNLYSYETYTIDFSSLWVEVDNVEIGGDIVVTPQ